MSSVRIAISFDGTYVALYQQPHGNSGTGPEGSAPSRFPFCAFQFRSDSEKVPQKGSVFGSLGRPFDKISEKLAYGADYTNDSLEESNKEWGPVKELNGKTISQLKGHFTGYGKFLARDKFKSDNEVIIEGGNSAHGDYFVAINESRINVYDVDKGWKPLFGHNIGDLATMESRTKQLQMLHQSISGPQFVWQEDKQNVSVWDLETGSNIKYISVNNPVNPNTQQDIISYLAVSPGGKLLALAGKDWIRTYFMDSCIEICKTTIKGGSVQSIEFTDQGKNLLVTIDKPSPERKNPLVTIDKPSSKRTLVIMDALNLSSWHIHMKELPPDPLPQSFYARHHIAQPSTAPGRYGVMMIVDKVLRTYDVLQPGETERAPLVSCRGKYVTNPSRERSRSAYSLAVDFENKGWTTNPRGKLIHESDSQAHSQASSFDISIGTVEHPEAMRNEHRCHGASPHGAYSLVVDSEIRKNGDQKQKLARVCLYNEDQKSPIMTIIPEPWRTLDEDEVGSPVKASFLSPWPQFIIVTSSSFQVWNLPCTNSDNQCELALSWVMLRSGRAKFRGKIDDYVQMIRKTVVIDGTNVRTTISGDHRTTPTLGPVSIPKTQCFTLSETIHCINSFPLLAYCYADSSPEAQNAIIRYVVKHINHGPSGDDIGNSMMEMIASSAKWKCCSDILSIILGSTDGKWIPRRCTPTMRIRGGRQPANPILHLLKNAKKDPYAFSMAEQMMDYCIREAKSQCDPAFLHPVSACLPELVDHHPEIAIDVTRRSSLVPIRNKNFVVDRAIISSPLLTRVLDWVIWTVINKRKKPIYRYEDPVFQLKSQLLSITAGDFTTDIKIADEISPNPVNHERFREEVYVAPYSLLWHYRDEVTTPKPANAIMTRANAIMTWAKDMVTRLIKMISTKQNIILKAITLGCYAVVTVLNTLNPLNKPTLRLNFRSRKYHESPAIAALISYKWNSVAWKAWTIRILYQGLFLVSVILITGNQIYPVIKIWHLIVPICLTMLLGLLGLYLEALEFADDYRLYLSSPYNPVDVVGYLIPTAGFVQFLISIIMFDNTNAIGDTRVLSIGISVVYFQVANELRVFRDICNLMTNIWNIVWETRFFIIVFVFFIISWTHTILHMLRGKSNDCLFVDESGNTISYRWDCPVRSTDFPDNPFTAYVTTFFIMGGDFSSISEYIKTSGDLTFLFVIAAYYAFMVFLLLNVLIAVMNSTTSRIEDEGTLAWLDNLYHHVGKAENLSFDAPGLRQQYDRFPQYVYYTVSQKRIKELEESGNSLEGPQEKGAE
ncbi:MAG: hypothetical protein J3Q66DRAFT_388318 [Benniella sp.]|nr:MAG: hypothetical protein J3Q66DRAFT_388318 [Benniella sp.]